MLAKRTGCPVMGAPPPAAPFPRGPSATIAPRCCSGSCVRASGSHHSRPLQCSPSWPPARPLLRGTSVQRPREAVVSPGPCCPQGPSWPRRVRKSRPADWTEKPSGTWVGQLSRGFSVLHRLQVKPPERGGWRVRQRLRTRSPGLRDRRAGPVDPDAEGRPGTVARSVLWASGVRSSG